uniref:Ubiquitin-like protease family profile domain-containing protein n=1 Tax=Timema douglasi TaxID=61478 RepID=A0A7R8VQU8_TIMDO|nr:unnamed protein product [Timema douglasi]
MTKPCILIFDSYPNHKRTKVVATLREYLDVEFKTKYNMEKKFTRDTMRGSTPLVPLQDNGTDCGLFTLQYAESFLKIDYSIARLGFTVIILSTILPLIPNLPYISSTHHTSQAAGPQTRTHQSSCHRGLRAPVQFPLKSMLSEVFMKSSFFRPRPTECRVKLWFNVINRFEDIEKDSNVLTEYRNYKVSLKDDSVSSYRKCV